MGYLKAAVKTVLPRDWWDALRRLRRESHHFVSPKVMTCLERMRDQGFKPAIVMDVGAATGDWTRSCLRIFPEAQYILVEPQQVYWGELAPLIEDRRIRYVQAAAGRQEATLPLASP